MSLLLPTDGCEKCLTATSMQIVHPYRVDVMPARESRSPWVRIEAWLKAWYRCPSCGYFWFTGWSMDSAERACPGCDLCRPLGGAA